MSAKHGFLSLKHGIRFKYWLEYDNFSISDEFLVHIPDKEFRNYLTEEYYIQFTDNKAPYKLLKNITKINYEGSYDFDNYDVCGSTINDLTGIEYFTSLLELNCSNINLNTNLNLKKILYCAN